MPYRSLNGSSNYLASAAAPAITAPPFWLAAKFRTSAASNQTIVGLFANGVDSNHRFILRTDGTGRPGVVTAANVTHEANGPIAVSNGAWTVIVGQWPTASLRFVWGGQIGNFGVGTTSQTLAGINRLTIGRRDDKFPGNYMNGDIAWVAAGRGMLTLPQVRALLGDEPPVQVARGSIVHFYPMLGGTDEPDVLGGLTLAVTGAGYSAGGPATIIRRAPATARIGRLATTRKLRARVSIGDTWYEAKVPLGSARYATAIMEIDDAADELRLRLNDGAPVVTSLGGGTPNTQTGDLHVGVGLNAGAVVPEGSDAARWSALHAFAGVLDAATLTELQADLADHLAPITAPAVLVVPANGTASLDVSPYVQDLEQGWAITSASSGDPAWAVTVDSTTTISVDTTANSGGAAISVTIGNNRNPRRSATIQVAASIAAPAFANGCLYRRPVDVDPVPGATFETLESFPLKVELSGLTWLRSVANSGDLQYHLNNIDLIAETVDGTAIPVEYEPGSYDPINGSIVAWASLPAWNPTQKYTFYLYYHNRLVASAEDLTVWADYLAVNHGGSSTRNPANLDIPWDTSGIVDSAGYIGVGADCADAASLAAISTPSFLNGLDAFAINLVKKSAAENSNSGVIGAGDLSADGVCPLYVRDAASATTGSGTTTNTMVVKATTSSGSLRWVGPNGFTDTEWTNLLITWRPNEDLVVYADGVLVEKTSDGITRSGTTAFGVGPLVLGRSAQYASLGRWTGEFDEVRFCGLYRSAAWAYAEHASWQAGFLTIGSAETVGTAVDRIVPLPDQAEMSGTETAITIDVLTGDIGPGTLTIDSLTQPSGDATVALTAEGTIRFQRNTAPAGVYTFTYTLSNGDVTSDPSTVTVTVRETLPTAPIYSIAADTPLIAEPVSGTTPVRFTVTRSGKTDAAGSVVWTLGGTAVAADFATGQAVAGQVLFAAGETSKTITVNLAADLLVEGDETIILTLANPLPAGAVISGGTAQTTVTNTSQPVVSIAANAATVTEGTSGEQNINFTVTRTGDTSGSSSVDWTKSGTTAAGDFNAGDAFSGTLNFTTGQTTKTITFRLKGDGQAEGDETIAVGLSNPSGCVLGTISATTTVVDSSAPANRPKAPPAVAASRQWWIGGGGPTFSQSPASLSAALAGAAAGDHIYLPTGATSLGSIVFNGTFSQTNPIVIRGRSVTGAAPASTLTGQIKITGQGYWFHEIKTNWASSNRDQGDFQLTGARYVTITRCWITGRHGIECASGNIHHLWVGWSRFTGRNLPTSVVGGQDRASNVSHIFVRCPGGLTNPLSGPNNIFVYRNFFWDDVDHRSSHYSSTYGGESMCIYVGHSHPEASNQVLRLTNVVFEENYFPKSANGNSRPRSIYSKRGCDMIRNRDTHVYGNFGQRHGAGSKIYGNRVAGQAFIVIGDEFAAGYANGTDVRNNVSSAPIRAFRATQRPEDPVRSGYQAADWVTFFNNQGALEIGYPNLAGTLVRVTTAGGTVSNVRIYQHPGAIQINSSTDVDLATIIDQHAANPLGLTNGAELIPADFDGRYTGFETGDQGL